MTLGTAEECAGLPYDTSVALTSTGNLRHVDVGTLVEWEKCEACGHV
jgi:hypothetical protein